MGLLISWIALIGILAYEYHKKKEVQRYIKRRNQLRDSFMSKEDKNGSVR